MRAFLVFAALLIGCTTAPSELDSHQATSTDQPAAPSLITTRDNGYLHVMGRSHFDIGTDARESSTGPLLKTSGSRGTFATNRFNGAAFASLSSGSAIAETKFTGTSERHNALVREYLVGAGIPSDQIERVQADAILSGHGSSNEPAQGVRPGVEYRGYISALVRSIEHVPIVDSVAWARLGDDGSLLAETIFWPSVPDDAVRRAVEWTTKFADPVVRADYLARVNVSEGRVVIRHSSSTVDQAVQFFVSFDVVEKRGHFSVTRHFDEAGVEFRLPQEASDSVQRGTQK